MTLNPAPLLSVRDVSVTFPIPRGMFRGTDRLRAVDGVSFDLFPGETLGIVGESGCGKSTLGRAVLKLIEPSGGTVAWLGQDLAGLPESRMRSHRRDMQVIFQDPLASLDPRMTVGDIIGEPLHTFHPELKRDARRARIQEMMAKVGLLPEMINRYPHEFSGGQAQRIGIARAMILNPKLIVCDEPVSALDVSIQAQIVNLLLEIKRKLDLTILFITHDLAVVGHISDRVAVMYLGRIVELADTRAVFSNPRHPYTEALFSAIPTLDPTVKRSRILLKGDIPSPLDPPSGCAFRTRCRYALPACADGVPPLREVGQGHLSACIRDDLNLAAPLAA